MAIKLKLTKKEAAFLNDVLIGSPIAQNAMGMRASIIKRLDTKPSAKVKGLKPLSKKAMKDILADHLPKNRVTTREEFLGGIRDRINASLAN